MMMECQCKYWKFPSSLPYLKDRMVLWFNLNIFWSIFFTFSLHFFLCYKDTHRYTRVCGSQFVAGRFVAGRFVAGHGTVCGRPVCGGLFVKQFTCKSVRMLKDA
jgi:hypothetical protein